MSTSPDPEGPGPLPGFSWQRFWKMCDANMSNPVALGQADPSRPFVYDRRFGFFYVPSGHHQQAMSLLLAFHHDLLCGIDVAEALGLSYSSGTADHWLEQLPGTAFRSSQGSRVLAGRRGNLNPLELRRLGEVTYVLKDAS